MRGGLKAGLAGLLLLTSCGGGTPAAAPAGAPPQEGAPPAQAYPAEEQPGYGAQPAPGSGDFAQPPAAPPPPGQGPDTEGAQPSVEQASLEFDRAAAELSAAGTDCPRACKALGSMNRASERICALDPDQSAAGRCRRAKDRVTEASERVRRSCACP